MNATNIDKLTDKSEHRGNRFQINLEKKMKESEEVIVKPKDKANVAVKEARYKNIMLLGNSGVGKSTLVNAVLSSDVSRTGMGDSVTKEIEIHPVDELKINLIDTMGMDYNAISQYKIKQAFSKWSKQSFGGDYINMIWFCVDGMSGRLFQENIQMLSGITKYWKNVPVIIVITKSFSETKWKENEDMVMKQLIKYGNKNLNVCGIISVVAKELEIGESNIVLPVNIDKLIDMSLSELEKNKEETKRAIKLYAINSRKYKANLVVGTSVASSVVVGAIPIPIADALILVPLQTTMATSIAGIYGVNQNKELSKRLIDTLVSCGTVSVAARATLSGLKALIPGGGALLNALVAGSFTLALGEISVSIMEKIYLGEKSADDIDWVGRFANEQFTDKMKTIMPVIQTTYMNLKGKANLNNRQIIQAVTAMFKRGD